MSENRLEVGDDHIYVTPQNSGKIKLRVDSLDTGCVDVILTDAQVTTLMTMLAKAKLAPPKRERERFISGVGYRDGDDEKNGKAS